VCFVGPKLLGFVLAAVLVVVYFHARSLILNHVIDKRERVLRAQTLSWTVALQGLTQSGLSLPQAVVQSGPDIPHPLGKQIHRLASNYRLGRPIQEVIGEVRDVLRLDAFSLLVTSITCAMKQGTPLREALLGVQETLEHRDRAERQLRAKTSSARSTIAILSVSPAFFLGMFSLFMPEAVAMLFSSGIGKCILAIIIATFYSGVAWARQLLRIR
jgi:tight adherence protein B